jgi:hypothetical protein
MGKLANRQAPCFYRHSALLIPYGGMSERIERRAEVIAAITKPELFNGDVPAGHG